MQLSSCVCLNSPCTKYRSYLLKLISICGHFLTVNNPRYGRCYVKYVIPLCSFPWILHSSRGKFSKIVWKCFSQVFKGFKYDVFKNFVFLMNVIIFQTIEPLWSHLKVMLGVEMGYSGSGWMGIRAEGDVCLWILRTPLKVKTNYRFEKIEAEVKFVHYNLSCLLWS